jgi:hypothetical protein
VGVIQLAASVVEPGDAEASRQRRLRVAIAQGAAAAVGCVGEVAARRKRNCDATKFEWSVQKCEKGNRRFLNPRISIG